MSFLYSGESSLSLEFEHMVFLNCLLRGSKPPHPRSSLRSSTTIYRYKTTFLAHMVFESGLASKSKLGRFSPDQEGHC